MNGTACFTGCLMKVKVRLFGTLPQRVPNYNAETGMDVDLPKGSKVQDLLACLKIPDPEADVVMVNGVVLKYDSTLEEGMCVDFFTLISGG